MVSVGAAWAVWSMMRCNAGRMAGSTAVGWLLAGSQLLWAVPDGGNDDGCGVGSTVVRSASGVVGAGVESVLVIGVVAPAIGVVWSGIGVVAPVSTCVPTSSVKSAAASGNSCVACSAPASGRGGKSAKGSVAVAAPAGENTTVSPSPLSPLLPENTAMVGASAASSAARQMVRGLLRSTPPAAPKGGIASAASATIAAGCPATAPAANGPACSPCQALGFNASKAMAFSN